MSSVPPQSAAPEESEGPKAPPPGRKFPCAKCGARLDFDPSSHGLKCPYCGYLEKIEPTAKEVQERDWEEFWSHYEEDDAQLAGRSSQVTCSVCGAVVLVEDKVQTDKCPYCSTFLENKPEAAKGMIQPNGMLAFSVTDRQAREAFNGWIAGRWFAPSSLRKLADLGRLSNIYVPHWTYDSMTYTHYTGERGDDYTETEYYTETDANGQQVQKSRQVTKTRWTRVSGMVQHFFDDVLICASHSVAERLIGGLAPWDLPSLEDFRAELLSGFQTERYAVGLREGFDKAKQVMDGEIRRLCIRDIGGNHQRLYTVNTQHMGVTFKHILLPVWLAPYRYQQQTYQILVNGRTGKVVGTRPYSWIKIALLVLVIAAVLGVVLFFVSRARGAEVTSPTRERGPGAGVSLVPKRSLGTHVEKLRFESRLWTRSRASHPCVPKRSLGTRGDHWPDARARAGSHYPESCSMKVGFEWLVDAEGCRPDLLADPVVLREVCGQIIAQLDLHVVGEGMWHQFPAPSGLTGLYLLTESHLACHTYPESGMATFNLYCCRSRPCWPWDEKLRDLLGAKRVTVRSTARGDEGGRA